MKSVKNPPLGIIEKDVEHPETLTFDYLNDENKPVYPETLEEQIEALKNDAQLEYFASCRRGKTAINRFIISLSPTAF